MPTARQIDAAASAARSLFRRPALKPLALAGIGAALLCACLGAAAAFAPDSRSPTRGSDERQRADVARAEAAPKEISATPATGGDATAAKKPAARPGAPREASEDSSMAARVYGALAITCIVLGGAAWLLRGKLSKGRTFSSGEKLLKIRDQLALDPRRRVVVLGVEGRTLVLGIMGEQMTLLSEYTDALETEAPAASEPQAEAIAEEAETIEPVRARLVEPAAPTPAKHRTPAPTPLFRYEALPPQAAPRQAPKSASAPARAYAAAAAAADSPRPAFRRVDVSVDDAPRATRSPGADRFSRLLDSATSESGAGR